MDETIKAMLDALKEYNAGYVRVKLGEYSIIVAENETADYMEELYDLANLSEEDDE